MTSITLFNKSFLLFRSTSQRSTDHRPQSKVYVLVNHTEMATPNKKAERSQPNPTPTLPSLVRITLLIVLGYEALGCLAGGAMLIKAPDGRYMDMPVDIMHGTFPDFLIPGIILFGLGILGSFAFFSVLRKKPNDWFLTGLTLGGLLIWFIVEIIILQELHWLHLMWGLPVLLGWVVAIPLIRLRKRK